MIKQHPCPSGDFTWWFGRCEEGPFTDAETIDKETAIAEAIGQDCIQEIVPDGPGLPWRAGFYLAWARRRHVRLDRYFDAHEWIDRTAEQMEDEDGSDEDGNNHPIDDVGKEDIRALEACVQSAIWHWQNRRAIPCRACYLDMLHSGVEWIVRDLPPEGQP